MRMTLSSLYNGFRNPNTIQALAKSIHESAQHLEAPLYIMEVCGGHTHTLLKYGLNQLMPKKIHFIHGPGCPVCIMPKERINHAIFLAQQKGVILVTLGDMIKVPGSNGTLQTTRAFGADVRFIYSPMDVLKIAQENPHKQIIYFAIGFETTTPMSAALLQRVIETQQTNVLFYVNHVTVPEPIMAIMDCKESRVNALIAPSHVSVISGANIYLPLPKKYKTPVVVAGFEPVDMMESIQRILTQAILGNAHVEIEYSRSVTMEGNPKAQALTQHFFEKRDSFRWRGLGNIPKSALKLRSEFEQFDAEKIYANELDHTPLDDSELCLCGAILKGIAKPSDCKVFATACTPENPIGSCMVSSEGACAAYYRYRNNEV
jgi:hydrogenase expression/formation protein HypD